jgi:D-methionine transport system permease protein
MWTERLLQGVWDTLLMVGVSSLVALLLGIPMAVLLVTSDKGGIYQAPLLNRVVGAFVNLFRSIPFLILMVALIPFTRLVVGTTYGVWAAVVPLTIAATPFFARIAEVSLREVDHGLIEAAQAMGCRRWHIVWHVLLPEALPGIVGGFTITVVALINSSAMAGAIGAGGLGDIAYRYGYQRFDSQVMLTVIAMLVVLVAVIQLGGDRLARAQRAQSGHRLFSPRANRSPPN